MNAGWLTHRGRPSRRRAWVLLLVSVLAIVGIVVVLSLRTTDTGPVTRSWTSSSAAPISSPATASTAVVLPATTSAPLAPEEASSGEPSTLDFRQLATAAASTIYAWDTRTATYSQTYGKIRGWWHVLPDGSNPLTVLAEEFEATGTNSAAYASLTGAQGYRTSAAVRSSCDEELEQYVQYPPPWKGLHVCTVTLKVTEHATSGTNSYTAPVSVMVNCPPAATAPVDRCEMVGFYASADRIVY